MSWVPMWRERVIRNESAEKKKERDSLHHKVEALRKRQIKLTHKIQECEEEYDRKVQEASLRKAPTQNGSARRKYLDTVNAEHRAQKALRPSDRQIFSRMYSKVDNYGWTLDEMRDWYNKNTMPEEPPDMPLESYGFKAVWMPANSRAATATTKLQASLKHSQPSMEPLSYPPPPRETRSAAQHRIVAAMAKDPSASIPWHNDIALAQSQLEQAQRHPNYGNISICQPPFRPLVAAQ